MPLRWSILFLLFLSSAFAQFSPKQKADNLESFEIVWRTVRDRHPDPKLNGLNWQAVHDAARPRVAKARSMDEVRGVLSEMLGKLGASHYAIIPSDLYQHTAAQNTTANPGAGINPAIAGGKGVAGSVEPESPAVGAPSRADAAPDSIAASVNDANDANNAKVTPVPGPAGKLVSFGNLPETRVFFESRQLPGGAGYIRFNEFLDPVSIMPRFEAALKQFAKSPGIILDLRGNPGGIGIMAMGIAGFFVSKQDQKLGEMKMREATLKFVIFPRPETYAGPLAILVDAGSASTTEILAQGLQDLGRARIFGSRTAGAALPSDIIRLPDGDGFQFAQASYTSEKGKVLEGAGVTPDVEVRQKTEALVAGNNHSAGNDSVIEAAEAWILSLRE